MKICRVNTSSIVQAFRTIKVLVQGLSDVQTAQHVTPFGLDSNPTDRTLGVIAKTGVQGEPVVLGYMQKDPKATKGEIHLFSTNAQGEEQFRVKVKVDGTMEMNGDVNTLVAFAELKTQFDKLVVDHNNLVTLFNLHIHITTATVGTGPVGVISPTVTTDTPSTADITNAEIPSVKTA